MSLGCSVTMRSCCVPSCDVRVPLHSVPFASGLRWKQWLKMCPFLQKYSIRRLNDLKICRKHFIPEHIDHKKGKLTKDSFPLLNLPPLEPKILGRGNILEISPIQSNESINLRIIASTPSLHGQSDTSICTSQGNKNNLHETCLVYLKAEDKLGLPVDHNMYCMPSQAAERPECQNPISHMSSEDISSRDCTIGSIEAEQGTYMPANHYKYCTTPLQDVHAGCLPARQDQKTAEFLSSSVKLQINTEPNVEKPVIIVEPHLWTHIKEQRMTRKVSVTTQTNKAAQHNISPENNEQLTISIKHSTNQCLLDDDIVYVLPTNIVSNESAQTHKQPSIYLSPNVLNQLRSESSKHALFADEMEPINLPICHVTELSQTSKFNLENSSVEPNNPLQFNCQSIVMKPLTSVVQPLHTKLKKQTLKPLVRESLNVEERADLQPSPVVTLTETTVCQQNPISNVAPVQAPLHSTEMRRVCLNKQKSTPNELMLRMQNIKLAKKIKSVNSKCKRIKSKIESAMNIAKQFIKGYPLLSREGKALIDTQLRLVVAKTVRYNEEEKLFALRLHQLSPECYRFLQKYLKLPSKDTIHNIIKNP